MMWRCLEYSITHRIHVTGIYVHIWNMVNVGKYTIPGFYGWQSLCLPAGFWCWYIDICFVCILLHRDRKVNAEIFTMFFKDTNMNGEAFRWVSYTNDCHFQGFFFEARPQQNTHGGFFSTFPVSLSRGFRAGTCVKTLGFRWLQMWRLGDCCVLPLFGFRFTQVMSGKLSFFFGKCYYYISIIGDIPWFTEPGYWRMGVRFCVKENVCSFVSVWIHSTKTTGHGFCLFQRSGRIIGDFKRTVGRSIRHMVWTLITRSLIN